MKVKLIKLMNALKMIERLSASPAELAPVVGFVAGSYEIANKILAVTSLEIVK